MKILHITFEAPGEKSGGALGVYQSANSILSTGNQVDYIGPEFEGINLEYRNKFFLSKDKNKLQTLKSLVLSATPSIYINSFFKITKGIKENSYDVIYIDFSRYWVIAKWARKICNRVIVRVHNIESEYLFEIFKNRKSVKALIKYLYVRKFEKKCLNYASDIIFLTKNDQETAQNLYHINIEKTSVIPVCIEKKIIKKKTIGTICLTYTGSLNFPMNSKGILFFIDYIWDDLLKCYPTIELVIAGKKPTKELIDKIGKHSNIKLYNTPSEKEMNNIFNNTNIYIAPVFNGAGMKVKVAEALSYGLLVVGTEHALIGYDAAITANYAVVANSIKDWKNNILYYISNINHTKNLRQNILAMFYNNYSMTCSQRAINRIIRKM